MISEVIFKREPNGAASSKSPINNIESVTISEPSGASASMSAVASPLNLYLRNSPFSTLCYSFARAARLRSGFSVSDSISSGSHLSELD
jgi:hypothetical protein